MIAKPMMKALLRVLSETTISDNVSTQVEVYTLKVRTAHRALRWQNPVQPHPTADRLASPDKKADSPLKPASPRKADFPLILQGARPNKPTSSIVPSITKTDKENVVLALESAGKSGGTGPVQEKQHIVMQDKTQNEMNKQNDKAIEAL